MKFLSVRDLRTKSAKIWKELPEEREMIVTNNGRPVAILTSIDESNFEESISAIRRSKAIEAVEYIQEESVKKGKNKLSLEQINKEIRSVRRKFRE
jgi:prevent-host-death family protein